jgi:hypothetical protein
MGVALKRAAADFYTAALPTTISQTLFLELQAALAEGVPPRSHAAS